MKHGNVPVRSIVSVLVHHFSCSNLQHLPLDLLRVQLASVRTACGWSLLGLGSASPASRFSTFRDDGTCYFSCGGSSDWMGSFCDGNLMGLIFDLWAFYLNELCSFLINRVLVVSTTGKVRVYINRSVISYPAILPNHQFVNIGAVCGAPRICDWFRQFGETTHIHRQELVSVCGVDIAVSCRANHPPIAVRIQDMQ